MAATPPSPLPLDNYRYLTGTNFELQITANAGGGQTGAYPLSAQMSVIGTVANAGDSVALPKASLNPPGDSRPGAIGQLVFLTNNGANACQVYGASPDTINGAATGTGISLPAGSQMVAWLVSYTQSTQVGVWEALVSSSSSGTVSSVSGTGTVNGLTLTGTVTSTGNLTLGGTLSGTASGLTAGNVTTNANLTGDVTSVGNATTLTNAPVIAKVLTGYTSGAGTVAATDSILQAIQKLNGNDALKALLAGSTSQGFSTAALTTAGLADISGASAGQIKFPATQHSSADVHTLDDYAEGTWTPTDQSGAGLAFTITSANYVKIGKAVFVEVRMVYPVTASASLAVLGGLPFSPAAIGILAMNVYGVVGANSLSVQGTSVVYPYVNNAPCTNAVLSGSTLSFSGVYFTAT